MFRAVLQQYKTEAKAAASPTEGATGEVAPSAYGGDEHARRAVGSLSAPACALLAAALKAAVACVTAQCAEGITTGQSFSITLGNVNSLPLLVLVHVFAFPIF